MSWKFKQIPYNLDIWSKQTVRRNTLDDSFEVVEIYSKWESDTLLNNKVEEIDEQTYIFEKKEIDLKPYLNKLSKKHNAVLYLFYYEGYSTKEMASILHIKENNVRVLLNRARNQLRKEIEADEK